MAQRHVEIVDRAHGRAIDDAGTAQPLDQLAQLAQLVGLAGRPCARRRPGSGGGTRRGRPSRPSSRAGPARRRRSPAWRSRSARGSAGAPAPRRRAAARGTAGRKSWPHCDTQWASSTQNSENFTPASASCTVGELTDSGVIMTSRILPSRTAARSAARSLAVRVESMRATGDAGRLQLHELILDERQQRRDHQRGPLEHQRGKLVGQRLAAAGRHDRQRVASRQHRFDDLGLPGAQLAQPEDLAHLVERAQERGRGRRGRNVAIVLRRRWPRRLA